MRTEEAHESGDYSRGLIRDLTTALANRNADVARLRNWVSDLQSGMYVNCVYCGHRYGPDGSTPVTMAEVLKKHVERCSEHPMSKMRVALEKMAALDSVAEMQAMAKEALK
jgi:hypothetical protein